jgi:hypothetical protein
VGDTAAGVAGETVGRPKKKETNPTEKLATEPI